MKRIRVQELVRGSFQVIPGGQDYSKVPISEWFGHYQPRIAFQSSIHFNKHPIDASINNKCLASLADNGRNNRPWLQKRASTFPLPLDWSN